jgi:hypothetical protein
MEKITVGMPNIEAAAGEVNADSIMYDFPPCWILENHFHGMMPLPPQPKPQWDPAHREISRQVCRWFQVATAFKPREHAYQKYHHQARLNPVQRFDGSKVQGTSFQA